MQAYSYSIDLKEVPEKENVYEGTIYRNGAIVDELLCYLKDKGDGKKSMALNSKEKRNNPTDKYKKTYGWCDIAERISKKTGKPFLGANVFKLNIDGLCFPMQGIVKNDTDKNKFIELEFNEGGVKNAEKNGKDYGWVISKEDPNDLDLPF